ncbi:MAG: hypothetical protein WC802_05740 [Patescibacteria group bacterium]|jgi:hypothetical protein
MDLTASPLFFSFMTFCAGYVMIRNASSYEGRPDAFERFLGMNMIWLSAWWFKLFLIECAETATNPFVSASCTAGSQMVLIFLGIGVPVFLAVSALHLLAYLRARYRDT